MIVPPPLDPSLRDRIEKTAAFAVQQNASGPAFLHNLVDIHRTDPNFAFLWPSDTWNSYFRHRLYHWLISATAPQRQWTPQAQLMHQTMMPPSQQMHQTIMPPPPLQMPEPPPQPIEPTSSFSFPPGLLPKLCADKGKIWAPYRPLEPDDIVAIGLPPAPSTNPYLRSQIDRFFAEVQDYRPGDGGIRTKLDENYQEDRSMKDKDEGDRGDRGSSRIRRYYQQARKKPVAGMQDDGTFAGSSVSQHAGLGVQNVTQEDAYASYRRAISSGYHEMIRSEGQGHSNIARGGR